MSLVDQPRFASIKEYGFDIGDKQSDFRFYGELVRSPDISKLCISTLRLTYAKHNIGLSSAVRSNLAAQVWKTLNILNRITIH